MQLYLSSYRLGDDPPAFARYFSGDKHVAVVGNAMDGVSVEARREHVANTFATLKEIGLSPVEVDLREYFEQPEKLAKRLNAFPGVWVRGGNTFVLRRAMLYSGMDLYIQRKTSDRGYIYGGYSAGVVLLGPTLRGVELVDDPHAVPPEYKKDIVWDGLGILEYTIVPHYRSDHPESARVEETVTYCVQNNIPYKTLRDGQVIVGETK